MTFQPPPPPPGGNPPPPPPPPPGQWGPPPGGGQQFDPKTVNPLDWAILGIGLLTFIFSFISYYTYSYGPYSVSWNAWHGFFGWFAMLLALVGSGVVAMELFAPQVKMPWPNRVVGLAAYAVATLCVILAIFVIPGNTGGISGIDKGHGFGYWASLVLIIAGLVVSLMRVQQTGTKLPGALGNLPNIGAKGPQGGVGGGPAAPPPPPAP
jgi:hypothetical protein